MQLSDLKTGMHVIFRDGSEYVVLKDTCLFGSFNNYSNTYEKNIVKSLSGGAYTSLDNYDEDFTSFKGIKEIDIVEVYMCDCVTAILESVKDEPNSFTRIFAEQPKKQMTLKEIEKALGYEIEIVGKE